MLVLFWRPVPPRLTLRWRGGGSSVMAQAPAMAPAIATVIGPGGLPGPQGPPGPQGEPGAAGIPSILDGGFF